MYFLIASVYREKRHWLVYFSDNILRLLRQAFSGKLIIMCFPFLRFSVVLFYTLAFNAGYPQSWQAEIFTGWTSGTEREALVIYNNIHVGTSVSRSVTPHWRAMSMYLFQSPGTDAFPRTIVPSFRIHNISAGMVYEEPDQNNPQICLYGGWLVGAILYDPVEPSISTEAQPVVNTVMGLRGHIRSRISYKIQALFLMPIFSDRDRLFDADLQLGAGPILTQIAANVGVSYTL